MGYYAWGSGYIEFKKKLSDELLDKIYEATSDVFYVSYEGVNKDGCTTIDLDHEYDKYYDDEVICALKEIAGFADIKEAHIEFSGEDYCFWKYIYEYDEWVYVEGYVVYRGEELENISDEELLAECERRGLINNKTYVLRTKGGDKPCGQKK